MDKSAVVEVEEVVEGKVDWKGRPVTIGSHGGHYNSLLVLALFAFENLATTAPAVNLITYFNGLMHYDIADASNQLTNFMGVCYILSILIAYVADSHIGRCKVIVISVFVEFLGFAMLTVQAHIPHLKPPPCNIFDPTSHCERVGGRNAFFLFFSLYLVALGAAGIKAGVPPHGADQFDEKNEQEALQRSSYFNWILLSVCIGAALSLVFVVYIQSNVGWDWGFGVSSVAIFLGGLIFIAGIPRYRMHVVQATNPITELLQVYMASFQNRKFHHPRNSEELYETVTDKESATEVEFLPHRDIFRFLDKAAIQTTPILQDPISPWKLCTVTQVEKAKIILGMLPIFFSTIIMSTCLAQLQTFSIQQAVTMDTRISHHFHIPPASLPIIPILFMIPIIPLYDRVFVPFARRITGRPTGITHLQRIGVGLVLSCISMSTAALMEVKRKNVAATHGMLDAIPVAQPLPISMFWLSFQFFIFGIADMFTYVGLLEFFYSESPLSLKSFATAFLWCSVALGYFLSTIIVKVVNRATKNLTASGGWLAGNNLNRNHLNLFYWLLAIVSFINFLNYLFWARWYKYRPPQVQSGSNKA